MAARTRAWQRPVVKLTRQAAWVLWLARRRLSRRLGPSALVGLGAASAALVLAAVSAGALLAEIRHLEREAGRLPESERAVKALWFGVPREQRWAELDRKATVALAPLAGRAPKAVVRFRQTHLDRSLVDLGAADGLARWVALRQGRLPAPCRPERCEVVQVGGSGRIPVVPGLNLVKVGAGRLRSGIPFGDPVSREEASGAVGSALRYHTAASPPFLLAEGVEELGGTNPLAGIFRSYGWVLPLGAGSIRPWELPGFAARLTRARSQLEASSDLWDVTGPTAELEAARATGADGARRLLLVGGEAAALLLAFAVLAATALRRDAEAAARRLTWAGARRWQLFAVPAAETAAVTLTAVAAGWLAGAGLAALAARRAGIDAGTVLRESVLAPRGVVVALVVALGAWAAVLAFLRARPVRVRGASVTPVDVAAAGALVLVLVALGRGELEQSATLLLLLPGLVAFVAAVAAARAMGPALRCAERRGRRGPPAVRFAALALARRPGRAAVAVSFLAVSFGLALFAESYRATLARGQHDQSAYAVPADFVLREDLRNLVPVTEAADETEALGRTTDVLRRFGDVARLEGSSGVTLLALPSEGLERMDGWRADFAAQPLRELARELAPAGDGALRVVRLPPAAQTLELPASVQGADVALAASVATPSGEFVTVELGATRGEPVTVLRAPVPPEARGGGLVALTIGIARDIHHDRGEGETIREPTVTANLDLGPLTAAGAPLEVDYGRWLAGDGAHLVESTGRGARLALILTDEFRARFRPRQPTDGRAVPAIVSPRLAAAAGRGGILPVRLSQDGLRVRVVGVAERFPSIEGDFVVADLDLAATALNANRPGAAVPGELWLSVSPGRLAAVAESLRRPPFEALEIRSRRAELRNERENPLARGTLLTLAGAAVLALALGLVGLLLVVLTDLRDDAGELFDLEAQGAGPATLRRDLRLRAGAVAAFGLGGGLLAGIALSALVVDFVTLTAAADRAEPPLALTLDWPVLLAAGAAYALAAALLVLLATRRAFREDTPTRRLEAVA